MATTVDPILSGIDRTEIISDPALRELYFGSSDTPGLINQATRAAQKAYLDQPAILQGTAGLSAQEQQARQLAQQGIGSYQPFLNRQENLIGQGISDLGQQRGLLGEALGGYRGAYGAQQPYLGQAEQRFGASYGAQQPYFGQAEQQLGSGLGGMFNSLGYGGPSARALLSQSLQGYDPRMANQYYNPFEDQVVGQTIEDVMKAGDIQDIQQRASDISQGGESAFGSRARLTADERRESLGRGLGKALGQIRSGGFDTAQARALQELQSQRSGASTAAQLEAGFGSQGSAAQRQYAQDLMGLGQGRSAAERQYGQDLLNIGGTRGELQRQLAGDITGVGTGIAGVGANLAGYGGSLGQLGATQQQLRGQDISQLGSLGATDRGVEEQRLARAYNQQVEQRQSPLLATQFVQGFAPQYQASRTQIEKDYGMPVDPLSQGLGAALSAYQALKPPMQQYQQPQYNPPIQEQQQQPQENVNMGGYSPGQYNNQITGTGYTPGSTPTITGPAPTIVNSGGIQMPQAPVYIPPAPVQQAPVQQAPVMPFPIPQMSNFPTFAMPSIAPQMPNLPSFVNNMPSIAPQMPQRAGPGGVVGARPGFRGAFV